jgi:hypothetical protein
MAGGWATWRAMVKGLPRKVPLAVKGAMSMPGKDSSLSLRNTKRSSIIQLGAMAG